ncbi:hypothetical protein H8N03_24390 [Ramlibacter sp. USB13]|uniref:Uncharacterized protein n=1 Tax=Ramlibacter cellulosilyticus TaxID=2764187 RepID=A0A923SDK2_9BURK|nr:hypothetical protein [Ramlibacter cellulosilyticus]MBC5786100.1 hypothetical protein [Ramlibacter cellulosilyticus]
MNIRIGMFACPSCQAPSISLWRKVGATDTFPARCARCNGLSFVSAWAHFAGAFVAEGLLWGAAIAALLAKSWALLLLFPVGLVAWSALVGAVFPLRPIARGEVRRARRKTAALLGGGAVLLAVIALVAARW